jgi:hypothetical protein
LRQTREREQRQTDTQPCARAKRRIGGREEKQAWRGAKRHRLREAGDRQQAALTEQWHELVGGNEKPDQVYRR